MEKLGSPEPAHPSPGAGPVAGVSDAKTAGVEGDEAAAVSSKLFRCACVRRWLPLVYREELYQVLKLTGPLVSRGKLKCWWGGLVCYSWSATTVIHADCFPLLQTCCEMCTVTEYNTYAVCKTWNKMVPMLYVSANLPVLDFTTLLSNLKLLCWVQISCLNTVHSNDLLHQFHLINDGLFGNDTNRSVCFYSCCLGFWTSSCPLLPPYSVVTLAMQNWLDTRWPQWYYLYCFVD